MGGATFIGVWTLLIIVGCPIKFGDGGIRGWGIIKLFVCTVVDARVVLIFICDPAAVFKGTAFTSICRPLPMGLGDEVDVRGGGSVPVWEDATGGWMRIEPILFTAVRPVGVCTLTCCYIKKYQLMKYENFTVFTYTYIHKSINKLKQII